MHFFNVQSHILNSKRVKNFRKKLLQVKKQFKLEKKEEKKRKKVFCALGGNELMKTEKLKL